MYRKDQFTNIRFGCAQRYLFQTIALVNQNALVNISYSDICSDHLDPQTFLIMS